MSTRTTLGAVALAAALAGGTGALIAAPTLAGAQSSTSTTVPTTNSPNASNGYDMGARGGQPHGNVDPTKGGHVGADGTKEVLLTGTTAEKVRAAAEKAVPDATILRVETDAEGSPYEAHMHKSDGTQVTVKVDSSFSVTKVETGP